MKIAAVITASLLLSATPALADTPGLERVAENARKRCEMSQQHIPAGKTVFAIARNCEEAGNQAVASEQARRAAVASEPAGRRNGPGTPAESAVE